MDYSRLSRETLIHEIEKLNRALERERMLSKSVALGLDNICDEVALPVYCVGQDYSILWANTYALNHFENVGKFKCYQVFFGRDDICPECHLTHIINKGAVNKIQVVEGGDTKQVVQLPISPLEGVFEYHYKATEGLTEKERLKIALKESELLSDSLKLTLENQKAFTEQLIKVIRTPLRALNGFFQMDPALRPNYLDTLKNTSHQLYELLNKMVFYSAKDLSDRLREEEPMNLKRIVELAANQSRLNRSYKSIDQEIQVVFSPTIPDVVLGDSLKNQLLFTYLFEWLMYTCKSALIKCQITEIKQTHEDMYIAVNLYGVDNEGDDEMEDSLNAIDHYAAKIGMDIVQQIVDELDFRMEINRGLKGEQTVELIAGYKKYIPKKESETVATKKEQRRKRILIADYEKPNISLDFFENYELYIAKTGKEAIELYFGAEPELTLLNIAIEDCDGFEVFDEIQRRRRTFTPVVAMSYPLIDGEKAFMKDYGFDDYYPKPLDMLVLKEIVKRYLR
ncbi:response regulator [Fusibacter sp. JL298sf-3]